MEQRIEWLTRPRSIELTGSNLLKKVRDAGFVIDTRGPEPILIRGLYTEVCKDLEEALLKALVWIKQNLSSDPKGIIQHAEKK